MSYIRMFGNLMWIIGITILFGTLCYLLLSYCSIIVTMFINASILIIVGLVLSDCGRNENSSIKNDNRLI